MRNSFGRQSLEVTGFLVSFGLLVWFIHHSFAEAPFWRDLEWGLDIVLGLALITAVYSVTHILSAGVSWVLLRSLGERSASFVQVAATVLLSQIAKYVPGNIAHHVGRAVLSRTMGFRMSRVLYGMFVETFWVLAVGMVFLIVFGIEHLVDWIPVFSEDSISLVLFVGVIGALAAPYLFYRPFSQLGIWFLRKRGVHQSLQLSTPSVPVGLLSVFVYVLNYSLVGLILGGLGTVLFDHEFFDVLYLGGVFAAAWIVGYITPGSPAGLGVREVILLSLLSPVYGVDGATGIAGILRLVTVSGDALTWLYGVVALRVATGRAG